MLAPNLDARSACRAPVLGFGAGLVAKVVIESNFSSFDLVAIEYGRPMREDATTATPGARRAQVLAGLGLDILAAESQQPFVEILSVAEIESALFADADIEAFPYDALPSYAETLRAIDVDLAAVESMFQQNNTPADLVPTWPCLPGGHS